MKILIILVIVATILVSLLAADQYYLSLQDKELKKSDWVQNCIPVGSEGAVPSIGLFNHTHSFDLQTCSWNPTEYGAPGFLESLYISFIEPLFLDIADSLEIKYANATCAAGALEWWEPCNDAGQNDVLSFKATTMILVILAITGSTIIFFVVKKWRKRK